MQRARFVVHVVGAFVGHVGRAAIGAGRAPVRRPAHPDGAGHRVARGVQDAQFPRALDHGERPPAVGGEWRIVRRCPHGDLRHDLVGGRVQQLDRVDPGEGKEHPPPVWAQLEPAGCLVQRHAPDFLPLGQVQPDERRGALLLGGDPPRAPVSTQRAVVWLGDRHVADHAVRRGVDDQRAVRAPARDQHSATVP